MKVSPMAALKIEAFAREVSARKEALVAAFAVEHRLTPGRIVLRQRRTPVLVATWPEPNPGRRPPRSWLKDLLWRFAPGRRAHVRERAAAFHALGLRAADTVLFEEYAGPAPTTYYAERASMQVTCRLCRRRVALADWDNHMAKRHPGMAAERVR